MRVLLCLCLLLAACAPAPELNEEPPRLPVRVEKLERTRFQPTLTLLGVVRPSGEAEVIAPTAGRLRYPARFRDGLPAGAPVAAGEVLARLFNPGAELALSEARLHLEAARTELARQQRAFDAGLISASHLAPYRVDAELSARRLTAAQQERSSLDLRSPLAGRLLVDRRLPPEGEVSAGTVIARIAATGRPRVEGRAAAADRERLREGLAVRFVVPGVSARGVGTAGARGVLREVSPVVDAGGTVPVLADVVDGAGLPAPGEGVEVEVELDARDQALTVPEEALVVSEGGSAVFVFKGGANGIAHRRPVETGGRGAGRVEVLSGLSPGERVVVEGTALLTDRTPVTEIREAKEP